MSDCCSSRSAYASVGVKPSAGAKTDGPRCGQPGQPGALPTLKHQVKPEHLKTVEADAFNFCRTATCEAV